MECDNASMSIMICLVCSKVVTGGIMLSLAECVFFICVDFAFLCVCMTCGFRSRVVCKSCILLWGVMGGFVCLCLMSIMFD